MFFQFLNKSNHIGYSLAIILGLFGYFSLSKIDYFNNRFNYLSILIVLYFIYCILAEIRAIKLIGLATNLQIKNNNLIYLFLFKIIALITGGWFLYNQVELKTFFDYQVFSFLTYFFVSAFFEAFRLLRRLK